MSFVYSLLLKNNSHILQMVTKKCLFFEWESRLCFIVYYGLSSWVHFDPSCIHTVYILTIYTMWYRVGAKNAILVRARLIGMMSWLIILRNQCSSVCWVNCLYAPLLWIDFILLQFWVNQSWCCTYVTKSGRAHFLDLMVFKIVKTSRLD
mgnify:CR=1 FL=1